MIDRIEKALLFKKIDLRQIIIFRTLFVSALLIQLLWDWSHHINQMRQIDTYNPIPIFELVGLGRPTLMLFQFSYVVLLLCLLGTFWPKWSRASHILSFLITFLVFGSLLGLHKMEGSNYVHHSKNIVMFFLFILTTLPKESYQNLWNLPKTTISKTYNWPLTLPLVTLSLLYFSSGYCKLDSAGFSWADGHTLQAYLYEQYILMDLPQSLWLADRFQVAKLASIFALILELSFPLALCGRRVGLLYALGGLSLHIGILYFMDINFLRYHALAYVIFIPHFFFNKEQRMTEDLN